MYETDFVKGGKFVAATFFNGSELFLSDLSSRLPLTSCREKNIAGEMGAKGWKFAVATFFNGSELFLDKMSSRLSPTKRLGIAGYKYLPLRKKMINILAHTLFCEFVRKLSNYLV